MSDVLAPAADGAAAGDEAICVRESNTNSPKVGARQAPTVRPYQADAIRRVAAEIAGGRRRVLLVAPTASGKTIIGARIIADALRARRRVLVLAHRREIIGQTVKKLYQAGVDAGIIQAGFSPRPGEPVQVASVQTLHARAVRARSIEMPSADLVIVDEAHHVRARSYGEILAAYPGAIIIGLTATPCRGDGRGLGNAFEALIDVASVADLVRDGYLVSARIYAPSRPNLSGVRVERGDYVEAQLAERVDTVQLVGDVVEHWLRLAERRPTVVFATGVAHSVHIRDEFRRAGVLAEHIDGGTPTEERDRILAQLAAGKIELVTNALVLTEGWDFPAASCIVMARPTKSLGLYRQMVGRVLRPAPGKADALILDHAGAVFAHGFPDDPITWTLREDRRAENTAHGARGKAGRPSLTDCPECHAVRFEGQPCPVCHWRPRPKAAPVKVADGELAAVGHDRVARPITYDFAARRRFYSQLLWICRERNHNIGWAAHKYREKFECWPEGMRQVEPEAPDPEVRAWVRSRAIAYAKAMQKQRQAAQ
jgi:DNA repair protein RadD